MSRSVAIQVEPIDPSTGLRVTLGFCDTDDDRLTAWNGEFFWPGIIRNLALNREGWNGDFTTAISLPQAAIDVSLNALRSADANSPVYRWGGAPFTVWTGEPGTALEQLFVGRVADHSIEDNKLTLTAQVDSEPFDADVLSLEYDGSGLDGGGDEGLREFPKPAAFGFCVNLEPLRINEVDNVYQCHGYGPIEGIDGIYERARSFGPSVGDFATYDELVAADVAEGSWATCLAQGMFRMGAPPFGVITADVRGDNEGGFHQTTAAIIRRLAQIALVNDDLIDDASLDAFETAVPYPINLYVTAREPLITLIQRLAQPCNAQAAISWLGLLQVTRFGAIPAEAISLDAQGRQMPAVTATAEQATFPPWWMIEMTANRNWRKMSKDEIAFDEEDPTPVPRRVYRRWPVQPDVPTEISNAPQGWYDVKPDLVRGQAVALDGSDGVLDAEASAFFADKMRVMGPLWMSEATQIEGEAQDGWSEPVLDDAQYRGWSIWSLDDSPTHPIGFAGTNRIKAGPDCAPQNECIFTVDRPIKGPFSLSFTAPSASASFFAGVMEYDPLGQSSINWRDMMLGFFVPQEDQTYLDPYQYDPYYHADPTFTGIVPFEDYDYGYRHGAFESRVYPNSNYRIELDGQCFWLYIDGQLARTYFYSPSYMGTDPEDGERWGFWPLFCIITPDAEITNIVWEEAQPGRRIPYDMSYAFGSMRYLEDEAKWQATFAMWLGMPEEADLDNEIQTNGYVNNLRVAGVPGFDYNWSSTITSQLGVGIGGFLFFYGFEFAPNGQYYTYGLDPFSRTRRDGPYSYVPGVDVFAVEYAGRTIKWTKNGKPVPMLQSAPYSGGRISAWSLFGRESKISHPAGETGAPSVLFSPGGYIKNLTIEGGPADNTTIMRTYAEDSTFPALHTFADQTIAVSGFPGLNMLLGETADIACHITNGPDGNANNKMIEVNLTLELISNVAVDYRPIFYIQIYHDDGSGFVWTTQSARFIEPEGVGGISIPPESVGDPLRVTKLVLDRQFDLGFFQDGLIRARALIQQNPSSPNTFSASISNGLLAIRFSS